MISPPGYSSEESSSSDESSSSSSQSFVVPSSPSSSLNSSATASPVVMSQDTLLFLQKLNEEASIKEQAYCRRMLREQQEFIILSEKEEEMQKGRVLLKRKREEFEKDAEEDESEAIKTENYILLKKVAEVEKDFWLENYGKTAEEQIELLNKEQLENSDEVLCFFNDCYLEPINTVNKRSAVLRSLQQSHYSSRMLYYLNHKTSIKEDLKKIRKLIAERKKFYGNMRQKIKKRDREFKYDEFAATEEQKALMFAYEDADENTDQQNEIYKQIKALNNRIVYPQNFKLPSGLEFNLVRSYFLHNDKLYSHY
jgi:hypothetical protein